MRKQKKIIEWLLYYPLIFSAWRSGGGGSWNVYSYTTRRCFFLFSFCFLPSIVFYFTCGSGLGLFFFFTCFLTIWMVLRRAKFDRFGKR